MQSLTDILRVMMAILATYRIAQLIVYDEGPFFIFARVRKEARSRANQETSPLGFWHGFAEWVHCPFCVGIWFALFSVVPILKPTLVGDVLLLWLGVAGGQAFLEDFGGGREDVS